MIHMTWSGDYSASKIINHSVDCNAVPDQTKSACNAVPDQMESAKLLLLFKNGWPNEIGNYRPISILPLFSKIMEK